MGAILPFIVLSEIVSYRLIVRVSAFSLRFDRRRRTAVLILEPVVPGSDPIGLEA
jgi:hypothetical protein